MALAPAPIVEPRVLLALTVVVLLAHIAVLREAAVSTTHRLAPMVHTFTARTLAPEAPLPVAQATVVKAATPQRPSRRPAATQDQQAPTSAPTADSEPPAQLPGAAFDLPPGIPRAAEVAVAEPAPPDVPEPMPAPRPPRDAAPSVKADKVPASMQLSYRVESNRFPLSLNAELTWQQDGANYDARLEVSLFGQGRTQTSRGRIGPQGLAPTRFSDKYRSEVAAHFNHESGKVTFSANTPDAPLLSGAQDRLSILMQLATMIAGAPDYYTSATTIAIQTIGPRDADIWLFTVGPTETLALPGGEQSALKLTRNPRAPYDQKVEVWLAPALAYLPARIRLTEANGDWIDQQWLSTQTPD